MRYRRNPTLKEAIRLLAPEIAHEAQLIYDSWEGEDDPEVGSGGICDEIANAIGGVIASHIEDVELDEAYAEGDDHSAVLASFGSERYVVDISYWIYESGGGYSWKKREGVKFKPSDIIIERV